MVNNQNTKSLLRSKLKASFTHLLCSLGLFGLIACWLYFILFPSFYFTLSGGLQGMLLMFCVDVVIGPFLTLLVYNHKKTIKELFFDFLVILLIQFGALTYGAYTVYQEHPKLTVIYDSGIVTTLSHRAVNETPRLKDFQSGDYETLERVPIVVYQRKKNKDVLMSPLQAVEILSLTDKKARASLNESEKRKLDDIEKALSNVWVLPIMGKYRGAYVVVDERFNFVANIGEKAIF